MKIYTVGAISSSKSTLALLEIPSRLRSFRIIKRWIKQRLGIEKCIYPPDFKMLKSMLECAGFIRKQLPSTKNIEIDTPTDGKMKAATLALQGGDFHQIRIMRFS